MSIKYYYTNENLTAIIKGLEPKSSDAILSVGGSGDQAFALVERAGLVVVADTNPAQMEYISRRKQYLRDGDYARFLGEKLLLRSMQRTKMRSKNSYFKMQDRLEKIRNNLENLILLDAASIFDIAELSEGFDKIYLSNAIGYNGKKTDFDSADQTLQTVAAKMNNHGLIYLVVTLGTRSSAQAKLKKLKSVKFDENLSKKARRAKQNWIPFVYRTKN